MPDCMPRDCTNNSSKTKELITIEFPQKSYLRIAWLVRIRPTNPRARRNSSVCPEHFAPDRFKVNILRVVSQAQTLLLNSLLFPRNSVGKPRHLCGRRNLRGSRHVVLSYNLLICFKFVLELGFTYIHCTDISRNIWTNESQYKYNNKGLFLSVYNSLIS